MLEEAQPPVPPPQEPAPQQPQAQDTNPPMQQASSLNGAMIMPTTDESAPAHRGIPMVVVVVSILLGVSLIIVAFFAYENYQLRQTSLILPPVSRLV